MKKVAIYARVSSDQQRDEKTIESQLAEVRETCKKDGVKIVKEYIDDGWSGETLARPALDELRDDAPKKIWETLYVWKADRFGRDHIDQGIVLRDLKRQGIGVVFGDRLLTEENKLLTDMEGIIAEHEKRNFLERTRRGRLHKAREGIQMHCKPPFGYRFTQGENSEWKLVANPEEAKIVRLIFDLYFKYQSAHGIAREFFEKGIKTRDGYVWRSIGISKALSNETYIGKWHYGKEVRIEPKNRKSKFYKRVKNSHETRDRRDWILIKVPAIISEAVFERVQELRKKNFKLYGKTKYNYILGGLLRCKKCGSRLVGFCHSKFRKRKKIFASFFYYRCSNRSKYFPQSSTCNAPSIRKDDLESLIWNNIKEAVQHPKVLIQYISHLNKNRDSYALEEERKDLLKKKNHIQQKTKDLWQMWDRDELDKEQLTSRIGEYAQTGKSIDSTIKEIDLRLAQRDNKDVIINNLKEFSKLNRIQLDTFTDQQKKDFLKLVVKEIWHNPDNNTFEIVGHIPIFKTTPREIKELMAIPVQTLVSSAS
jgi:site-specific DNA recombinase